MLHFELDESVADRLRAWTVQVDGVEVRDDGRAHQALEDCARSWHERAAGLTAGQVDGIAEARRLYRHFGVDPTRTRPSSEALLRRALRGQDLYRISNVVDVGNWVSLEYLLPLGLYDTATLEPFDGERVIVRVGHEGEEYAGIRKGPVHVGGRLCVADRSGAFGSPTSDSLRSAITPACESVAAIVFGPPDLDETRLGAAGRALAERLVEYAGGRLVESSAVSS